MVNLAGSYSSPSTITFRNMEVADLDADNFSCKTFSINGDPITEVDIQTLESKTQNITASTNLTTVAGTLCVDTIVPGAGGITTVQGSLNPYGLTAGSASVTTDLTVDTDTLTVDSSVHRVGVKKDTPGYTLDVGGTANVDSNLSVGGVIHTNSNLEVAGSATITGNIYRGVRRYRSVITGASANLYTQSSYEIPIPDPSELSMAIVTFYNVGVTYSGTVTPAPGLRTRFCTTAGTALSTGYYGATTGTSSNAASTTTYQDQIRLSWGTQYAYVSGNLTIVRNAISGSSTYISTFQTFSKDTNTPALTVFSGESTFSNAANIVSLYIDISFTPSTFKDQSYIFYQLIY